jgi:hypothetical protein
MPAFNEREFMLSKLLVPYDEQVTLTKKIGRNDFILRSQKNLQDSVIARRSNISDVTILRYTFVS